MTWSVGALLDLSALAAQYIDIVEASPYLPSQNIHNAWNLWWDSAAASAFGYVPYAGKYLGPVAEGAVFLEQTHNLTGSYDPFHHW